MKHPQAQNPDSVKARRVGTVRQRGDAQGAGLTYAAAEENGPWAEVTRGRLWALRGGVAGVGKEAVLAEGVRRLMAARLREPV